MDFKFPDVGEGIHEGTIVKWHVKTGEKIEKDDILCEVETDKAIVEIPSPEKGHIEKLYHKEGEIVKVGDILVSYTGEKKDIKTEKQDQGGVVGTIVDAKPGSKDQGPLFDSLKKGTSEKSSQSNTDEKITILPALRKKAKELGVDLEKIKPTGKNGQITQEDIEKANKENQPVKEETPIQKETPLAKEKTKPKIRQKYDFFGPLEYEKLSPVRKATMEHLQKNKDVISVSQTHFCDVTDLDHYRKKTNEALSEEGYHFTFLPFIFMGILEIVKTFPRFNAEWSNKWDELILKKYVNLAFAVDTDAGLLVPVIRRADEKDIKTITREISDLAIKAKDRTIDRMDMMGATITVTNYGSLGSVFATPAINFPNTCILGIGAIQKTPKLIDGKLEEKLILPITLTYDHRFIDGADAAKFLNALTCELTDPLRFNHGLVK